MTVDENVFSFARIASPIGGQHEDRCDHDRKLTEKIRGAAATEYRLARSAEGRADFRSFSRLQENRPDHGGSMR